MEDKDILRLYFERSEYAVEETKKKYGNMLRALAARILSDRRDAEECENDTYLGAWRTIPPQNPQNLPAYLARIARNQALKRYEFLRAGKRNRELEVSFEELEGCLADIEKGDAGREDELADSLNDFLGNLEKENRRVFLLRYWYCLSVREITAECEMTRSQVESRLFRTRSKLRQFLTERGFGK
ncbi:MAG: sigma-70 family RNA polymerase sigma factor [Lachnospiraceae bacterium]|nr:sigma-70 family RNA polymerase sigma factor [Lachnospiraceae bacterium]